MIGRTNAGGMNIINFKVVGNPQPANPKENTIWVNTDAKITGWYFSATQPENLAEGMVWFSTGSSSHIPFNSLKKNGLMAYPITAKQYINGALVYKEAKIYQVGSWVSFWDGYLYKSGNEYTEVTGGWTTVGKGWSDYDGERSPGSGTITRDSTSMTMTPTGAPSPVIFYAQKKIDLAEHNKLTYYGTLAGNNPAVWHKLMVWSDIGTYVHSNVAASNSLNGDGTATITFDISSLKGEYYIGFGFYTKPALTMYSLRLE